MLIEDSSNKLLIWFWEPVEAPEIISAYDKFWDELLTWSFTGIAKFGPWIRLKSVTETGSGVLFTLKATGSLNSVTTHAVSLNSKERGRGSYNLTTIEGEPENSSSNFILLAIIKSFNPKLR